MKFTDWLTVHGDQSFRGECPLESAEQMTFIAKLRRVHPDTYGRIVVHIQNEGKRYTWQAQRDKASGMTAGASDIMIPGARSFCMELKRRDHTKSKWQKDQLEYLEAAHKTGAYVCVALGADAAWQAFEAWLAS